MIDLIQNKIKEINCLLLNYISSENDLTNMRKIDLYDSPKGTVVSISEETIGKIKQLKSHISKESGYTPDGIMLQWRYSDNSDIINKDEIYHINVAMQFITMTAIMSDEFKKNHNVKPYHESLLRRLYLDVDEDDEGEELITTEFKRPFGNSRVAGDIAEEMEFVGVNPYINKEGGKLDMSLIENEYKRFIEILDAFMKDFELPYRHFESIGFINGFINDERVINRGEWLKRLPHLNDKQLHSYLSYWKISKSKLRDDKIGQILDGEK